MNPWLTTVLWAVVQITLYVSLATVIYAAARRWGPSAGAAVAVLALTGAIAIWVFAFMPWPHWWTARLPHAPAAPVQQSSVLKHLPPSSIVAPPPPNAEMELTNQIVASSEAAPRPAPAAPAPSVSLDFEKWQFWLGASVIVGVVVAILRVVLALWLVRQYRQVSRKIEDGELNDFVQQLAERVNFHRNIEIRETPKLSSAATVGWLRPIILLPADWREWTSEQRCAVFAHEVGHIVRRDYFSWLLAQISLALNFYHPLVHWLVHRLRLEQELAADALASSLLGGKTIYLTALASLALRQDDQTAHWAARPFLSSRGTLIRRVMMLRETKFRYQPLKRGGQAVLSVLLVAGVVVIAGLRGPWADENGHTNPAFDLTYVPENPFIVCAVKPQAYLKHGDALRLVELLSQNDSKTIHGVPLAELTEIVLIQHKPPLGIDFDLAVLRRDQPFEEIPVIKGPPDKPQTCEKKEFEGKTYYVSGGRAYYQPSPNTFIVGNEAHVRLAMSAPEGGPKDSPWLPLWNKAATQQAALLVGTSYLRGHQFPKEYGSQALADHADFLVVRANVEDQNTRFETFIQADGLEGAQKIESTLPTFVQFAQKALANDMRPRSLATLANTLLRDITITRSDSMVQASSSVTNADAALITEEGLSEKKMLQSQMNLRQLALGLHNFQGATTHFPQPAAPATKDGKFPVSWRVLVLPFIEENKLFQEYNLNEPWDSETNLKVLKKMPSVYRHPLDDPKSTNTSYFLLVGEGTVFDSEKPKLDDIKDGSSKTILVVEAERDVPWTKPEDLDYSPEQPLPELGGFFEGKFGAGLADGSALFFSTKIEQPVLRSLIEKADGKPQALP